MPARLEDAFAIAACVDPGDEAEMWSALRIHPIDAVVGGIRRSTVSKTGWAGDDILCVFGVVPMTAMSDHGMIWMTGTTNLRQHAPMFLRRCSSQIDEISRGFVSIGNWCDARNTTTLKWLKWLGFEIDPPLPHGVYAMPFHRFHKDVSGERRRVQS